ncbi:ABC-type branched-chain amino acid transport system, periplasmic component [Beggiatoa alba B18LD]|uniref:ABC-type branched-chain amino acid transport system, periplasmic component n=1 Tax=Beggiatoa alba B18LD TaxID=395493 RepID=I3CIH5_9GAMM|nr:branched-chain amino acid ABC transporter substrate-binding protein [Beggiatoa alba]EIJ43418.1 ABC-type branched-chain amino acid transport system, periplasmic component [Beggiatoa alba B18LD]
MKPLNQLFKTTLLATSITIMPFSSALYADEEISIAVAGPITGQYATFGHQMKTGTEIAVEDLNKAGGVLGKKLKLEVGDDACDPKQAVAVANQLANKKVALVAGHFCSGSSIPASKVYNEEGVIMISPGSTNPKLTEEGLSNVFRVCGRDDQQGAVAGEYIAKKYADKKVAILHDKSAYGKGLADETKKALNAAGKQEVMYEAITAGEKDYSAIVSKLKKEQIDVVYLGGYHTEAGLIIRQMRDQGMSTILAAGDALMTDEFWSITGAAGEGTLMTFSPDPSKNPIAEPIVATFRAKKIEPVGYMLYSYGAVQAWAQAVEKAGTTDAKKVEEVLRKETFKTVLGDVSFNAKGDVNAPGYVFYVWKNGKYDYVE